MCMSYTFLMGFLLRICFHDWNQAIGKVSGFCSIQTFNWSDKAHPAMSATGSWWRIKSQRYGHVMTFWNPGFLLWIFIDSDNLRFFPISFPLLTLLLSWGHSCHVYHTPSQLGAWWRWSIWEKTQEFDPRPRWLQNFLLASGAQEELVCEDSSIVRFEL